MLCSGGIRLTTVRVGPAGEPFWPLAEGLKLLVPLYCSVSTCKGELASAIAQGSPQQAHRFSTHTGDLQTLLTSSTSPHPVQPARRVTQASDHSILLQTAMRSGMTENFTVLIGTSTARMAPDCRRPSQLAQ